MGSSPGTEIPHSGQSSSDDSVRPKPGGIPFSGAGGDGAGLDGKTGFRGLKPAGEVGAAEDGGGVGDGALGAEPPIALPANRGSGPY